MYTPASSLEEREDLSPIVINNPIDTDSVRAEDSMGMAKLEGRTSPGPAESFEENYRDDYPEVLNEPEPDAIIDWFIYSGPRKLDNMLR